VPLILRVVVPFNEAGSGAAKGGLAASGKAGAGEDDWPRDIGLFVFRVLYRAVLPAGPR
jgi:hypothetical protein